MEGKTQYYTELHLSQEEFRLIYDNKIKNNYSKELNKLMFEKLAIKTTANKASDYKNTLTFQLNCTLCKEIGNKKLISVSIKKIKTFFNPVVLDVTGSCHHVIGKFQCIINLNLIIN